MELVNIVLTEKDYVLPILERLSQHNFHGSVVETRSIHHALVDADGEAKMFGGLTKVVGDDVDNLARPIIQVVTDAGKVSEISKLVKEVIPTIEGNGFIYVVPITYVEGL